MKFSEYRTLKIRSACLLPINVGCICFFQPMDVTYARSGQNNRALLGMSPPTTQEKHAKKKVLARCSFELRCIIIADGHFQQFSPKTKEKQKHRIQNPGFPHTFEHVLYSIYQAAPNISRSSTRRLIVHSSRATGSRSQSLGRPDGLGGALFTSVTGTFNP